MWDGKKSIAFKIFYDAIDIVEERKQDDEKSALRSVERSPLECDASC